MGCVVVDLALQVYISEDVYNQVRGKIPANYENLGKRKLKNIQTDVNVYRIV